MTVLEKESIYRQCCYKYGFITLCYLIEEYTQEENYEECQIVYDVLHKLNAETESYLPTKFDEDAVSYFKRAIKEANLSGDLIFNNLHHYTNEIKNMIK